MMATSDPFGVKVIHLSLHAISTHTQFKANKTEPIDFAMKTIPSPGAEAESRAGAGV